MKGVKCWAIRIPQGQVASRTIRVSKRLCIREFMADKAFRPHTWRQMKRWGWKCVTVTISEP